MGGTPEFRRGVAAGGLFGVVVTVPLVLLAVHSTVRFATTEALHSHLDQAWLVGHLRNFTPPVPLECPPCQAAQCPECPKSSCDLAEQIRHRLDPKPLSATILPEEQLALASFGEPTSRCIAPARDDEAQSKTLRKLLRIWIDPGPETCPTPFNMDAGLCIRSATKSAVNGETDYRCLPSALLIGAQKAGTRMLLNYLTTHPRLSSPSAELHFLNRDTPTHLGEFWRAYLEEFPAFTTHEQLGKVLTVEKTPEYLLMSAQQIKRLYRLLPSVKLVVSLRDPVDRLYSWFHFKCNPAPKKPRLIRLMLGGPDKGRVVACHDDAAITALPHPNVASPCTPEAFAKLVLTANGTVVAPADAGVGHAIKRGLYADQLRAWFSVFPKSQFFVLFASTLFENPAVELRRLETFLRIPHYPYAKVSFC